MVNGGVNGWFNEDGKRKCIPMAGAYVFFSIKWDADPHWFRTRMGRWLAIVNRESCGDKGSPHRNIPKCGI